MTTPKKRKVSKFTGIKVLLATMSIVGVLGFWNLFSVKALQDQQAANQDPSVVPNDPPPGFELGLPPLPTLVAVDDAPVLQVQSSLPADQPVAVQASPGEALPLRQVAAPTPMIIQQHKPVVVTMGGGASVSPSGGGGGGGGGKKAAASTHSSKP